MSIIIGNGMCLTYMETEVTCPICNFSFDCSDKESKAKEPVFKMRCPGCKSWVGISMPIFGGNTKCFEWNPPKTSQHRLEIITPNKINGKVVSDKPHFPDDHEDESVTT